MTTYQRLELACPDCRCIMSYVTTETHDNKRGNFTVTYFRCSNNNCRASWSRERRN